MSLFTKVLPILTASRISPSTRSHARYAPRVLNKQTIRLTAFSNRPPDRVRDFASSSYRCEGDASSGAPPVKSLRVEPRLSITFTCTASVPSTSNHSAASSTDTLATSEDHESSTAKCGHRSTHEFTKRSYEKGIVLIQCPGCKNRHLIADHLGWFEDSTLKGQNRTIEEILRAKGLGEKVKRGIKYQPEPESGTEDGSGIEGGNRSSHGDVEVRPEDIEGAPDGASGADRLRIE